MSRLKEQLDRIKPQFEKGGKYAKLHSVFDGFYTFLYTPNTTSKPGSRFTTATTPNAL